MSVMNPLCLKLIKAIFMVCLLLQVEFVHAEEVIRCIQKERQALFHFKADLIDTFDMLSSWTTADCCQWKGIRCSNLTGHILMLDLHGYPFMEFEFEHSYFYLRGKIHRSLMELQQLQYLNLSHNDFEGSHIPDFFGSLNNLRYLDLNNSKFVGKIPCQLGALSHLRYLDLRGNHLEGSIPSQLGNVSGLQFLDLRYNSLEGTIPSQLGKLAKLQELYLGGSHGNLKFKDGNHDGGQWLSNLTSLTHLYLYSIHDLNSSRTLAQVIAKLPKLRELGLSDCSLSDNFLLLKTSSHFKFSTTSLSVLDLSENSFSSSMIFQWVANFTSNLVELDLSGNLLEAPPSNDFGSVMNSLERLYLFDNRLKGEVMKSFMNMCSLRSLDMAENNLTDDLPSIVYNLSGGCVRYSLQELRLSFNQITGTLSDHLSIFSSLKTLVLDRNQLSGKIPEVRLPSQLEFLSIQSNSLEGRIPKSFGNACTLQRLNLRNNSLNEELPVLIHHLSGCARFSLKYLILGMNQINGTLPILSLFSSLTVLDLSGNRLSGRVSDTHFANMSMLMSLALSDNSLALTFTENWVPSFQLQEIQLKSCKLGPTFPKWLQAQNRFKSLDISNAGISGIVPKWFWDKLASQRSSEWMVIDISHNNLEGMIPNISMTSHYFSVSLASNQFGGPIPPFLLGSLYLDLSRNRFSETFSFLCAYGTVETLYYLDLSNNQLSGQIPNCWNNFKSLAFVSLSQNNFLGKIPTSMGSLLELRVLLLRNNSLTDEIPSSLRSCTELVMLDAGENRLSGPIPLWIGSQLQKLKVLSLMRNHFFGSLPLQLCNLNKIQVLDLSLNSLSGQIPRCFSNFTFMAQQTSSRDYSSGNRYMINTSYFSGTYLLYDLNAFLVWKGVEQMFLNKELLLLKSIDLSSNHFTEEIPAEIQDLFGLVSLNLSRNNLSGEIPSNIGKLTSLEFLDLSRNQLLDSIPSSLAQIDQLAVLDVSHNRLSGEIPTGTQLQSFNASNYEDNLDLCGPPLQKLCIKEESAQEPIVNYHKDEDLFITSGFYMSMAFGFVIGFWGIFGSITIKRSWRHAYFRFLNHFTDNVYVLVTVNFAKCKRWLSD